MTGDPGPDKQPEALTPDDPNVTKPAPADDGGKSLLARIPGGRTLLTVVAAIVAVSAIAATTWALARNGGDETATPIDDESGAVTFGPNQPDTTSSTTLPTTPTLPTFPTFPTDPTLPTFPTTQFSFPTASVPAPTFPTYPTSQYTLPTYPTSTFSYPTATYTPTYTPTGTPTTTGPVKTEVVPVAPQVKPINKRCGVYGSIRFASTTGVKYSLVVGNGKEGRYVVTAAARKGYVIQDGATRKWSGKLGHYKECPLGLRKVAASETGDGSGWAVKVRLWVPTDEDRPLTVAYSFANSVTLESTRGAGWSCGDLVDGALSCTYQGDGTPPTLNVRVTGSAPVGTVTLSADGEQVDAGSFDAG